MDTPDDPRDDYVRQWREGKMSAPLTQPDIWIVNHPDIDMGVCDLADAHVGKQIIAASAILKATIASPLQDAARSTTSTTGSATVHEFDAAKPADYDTAGPWHIGAREIRVRSALTYLWASAAHEWQQRFGEEHFAFRALVAWAAEHFPNLFHLVPGQQCMWVANLKPIEHDTTTDTSQRLSKAWVAVPTADLTYVINEYRKDYRDRLATLIKTTGKKPTWTNRAVPAWLAEVAS